MNFANYAAFQVAVQQLIEGDDLTNTFSQSTLDLIIGLGENRVYRELRVSTMLSPLSLVVTSNVATLPTDLIQLKEVYLDPTKPFEIIPLQRLRVFAQDGSTGNTVYAAQDIDTLQFWPIVVGTVLGKYYALPTALKTITWANATTFARYPEVFVFAAMVEAMAFLGFDARIPQWEAKYRQAVLDAKHDIRERVYGGSRMTVRAH